MIKTKVVNGITYEWSEPSKWSSRIMGETEGPYWCPSPDDVDEPSFPLAPVFCGKCDGTEFSVVHPESYSTWCICKCGNKFEVHSG